MALNLEAGLAAFQSQVGKSTYSMDYSRNYSDGTNDCSGAVYYALRAAGGYNYGYTPSTETLHDYLTRLGFVKIAENTDFEMRRGQVIIWGQRGFSAGAFGHTGIALDGQNWIECTAWIGAGPYGGTIISNHDQRWAMAGGPYFYAYELKGAILGTPTTNKSEGEIEMKCFYKLIDKGDTIYYFDGQDVRALNHPDEKHILNEIYKVNNGKDMPYFEWQEKKGPWNLRLAEVIKRKPI